MIGIFFATIIGFVVGLGRLSPNWLLSRIAGGYVELIRNLPLLFQILFWYLAVLGTLPNPRQSISVFGSFFLSNRGLVIPKPIGAGRPDGRSWSPSWLAIVASLLLRSYARRQLFDSGRMITDLALCRRPADRAAAAGRAGVRQAGDVRDSRN